MKVEYKSILRRSSAPEALVGGRALNGSATTAFGLVVQMQREIRSMKHKPASLILLLSASLCLASAGLSGCNTVKGAGQDLKSAGQAIERKAEQKKHY